MKVSKPRRAMTAHVKQSKSAGVGAQILYGQPVPPAQPESGVTEVIAMKPEDEQTAHPFFSTEVCSASSATLSNRVASLWPLGLQDERHKNGRHQQPRV